MAGQLREKLYYNINSFTGKNWKEQDLALIPLDDIPYSGKLTQYTIQHLADELRNWKKIIDYEVKNDSAMPIPLKNLFGISRLEFANAQYNKLWQEFQSRSPEEQSQAT